MKFFLENSKIFQTTKKNVEWPKFNLGEEFTAEYLDDSMHKVKINFLKIYLF